MTSSICATCGEPFQSKYRHRQYCSRRCFPEPRSHRKYAHGYIFLYDPSHPNANAAGNVREHVVVASRVLGKPIPLGAVVHHVNGDGTDNRPQNLVICEDQSYHHLLHTRQRIAALGGNPDTQKVCGHCGQLKERADFQRNRWAGDGLMFWCRTCVNAAANARYAAAKVKDVIIDRVTECEEVRGSE